MGRVRTKTVKKAARVIIEKYYTKLTLDFDTNKRIIEEVAVIPSKPLRNKVEMIAATRWVSMMTKILYTNFVWHVITKRTANWPDKLPLPLKYLIIYKIIIYIRIADGIFILMKQYPDESYHDSMILISKIRLPGSSLTWWRDSSAPPWEESPSSSRKRREKEGTTTCPMSPSSRRWDKRDCSISALFDQDLSCFLRCLLLHKCQITTCRTSPFTHHIWCKCLEACSQIPIWTSFMQFLIFKSFSGCHRGWCWDQGDAEDDGFPVHPRPADDHQQQTRILQQILKMCSFVTM